MEQGNFAGLTHDTFAPESNGEAERRAAYPKQRRALFRMLARAEENERRRIANELHDTTAQDLVAITLNLHQIVKTGLQRSNQALFDETFELLQQAQRDLRTMSYVLHPPAVNEAGLAAALGAMVKGLSNRTRFRVAFESGFGGRLPAEIEEAFYRVAQEALFNVCRHARPSHVRVRLDRIDDLIRLEVEDNGVGFDPHGEDAIIGVGLRAVRGRMNAIGGVLRIVSSDTGTRVQADLPEDRLVEPANV